MIRINLLEVESARPRPGGRARRRRREVAAGGALLLATALWIGVRAGSVRREHARTTVALAAAERELGRLAPLLERVRDGEARRRRLTERLAWLEARRRQQDAPVRLLDEVGRSLPDGVWLTELRQAPDVVVLRGRAVDLIAVSDFAADLGRAASFTPPVAVVDSQVDGRGEGAGPVRFELHAALRDPAPDGAEAGRR